MGKTQWTQAIKFPLYNGLSRKACQISTEAKNQA